MEEPRKACDGQQRCERQACTPATGEPSDCKRPGQRPAHVALTGLVATGYNSGPHARLHLAPAAGGLTPGRDMVTNPLLQ